MKLGYHSFIHILLHSSSLPPWAILIMVGTCIQNIPEGPVYARHPSSKTCSSSCKPHSLPTKQVGGRSGGCAHDPEGGRAGPVQAVPSARTQQQAATREGAAAASSPRPRRPRGLVRAWYFIPRVGDPASYRDRALFEELSGSHLDAVWREFGAGRRAGYHSHGCPSWEMVVG